MTRKEELKQRAITIVDEFPICFETETEKKEYQEYVFDMLLKVEREVLSRIENKLDDADHMGDIRNWLYDQQERLGS